VGLGLLKSLHIEESCQSRRKIGNQKRLHTTASPATPDLPRPFTGGRSPTVIVMHSNSRRCFKVLTYPKPYLLGQKLNRIFFLDSESPYKR
jgi:hypothetical protein